MRKVKIDKDTPIEAIRLSKKTYTLLHDSGYKTVNDIVAVSHEKLTSIPGFSDACLAEVHEHLDDLRYGPLPKDHIPSVMGYVKSWKNDSEREIMLRVLNGTPVKDIANECLIPENHIREKIKKVMMYRQALYEDRYIAAYRKYHFTCEDFCELFGVEPYVYRYLSLINSRQKGTEPAKNAQNDPDIQCLISEK